MKPLILALLLLTASPALGEPTTLERCEALVNNYVKLNIEIEQAGLALSIQKGIVEVCQKLIELEKPAPAPAPEPTSTPEVKAE